MGLKELRKEKGLTQEQLAEKSGLSLDAVRAYEQAKREIKNAKIGNLSKLAFALGCSVENLVAEDVPATITEKILGEIFQNYYNNENMRLPYIQALILIGALIQSVKNVENIRFKSNDFLKTTNYPNFKQDDIPSLLLELERRMHEYKCFSDTNSKLLQAIYELLFSSPSNNWGLTINSINYYIVGGITMQPMIRTVFKKYAYGGKYKDNKED